MSSIVPRPRTAESPQTPLGEGHLHFVEELLQVKC